MDQERSKEEVCKSMCSSYKSLSVGGTAVIAPIHLSDS